MNRKRDDATATVQRADADHLKTSRLTWFGLCLAALGWLCIVGEATLVETVTTKLPHPVSPSLHSNLFEIAMCIVASGFSLAIIGVLQSGFGALNRFFEAVLMRSAQRNPAPSHVHVEPEMAPPPGRRAYRILPDGSVEVETIVGTRRFNNLNEARDFI